MAPSFWKQVALYCSFGVLTGFCGVSHALPAYTITDLGAFGLHGENQTQGVNNAGQVTGGRLMASGESHAFLYRGGTTVDLGTVQGTPAYSTGTAINATGQVAGYSSGSGGNRAFLYSNGVMTNLGTVAGNVGQSWAYSLNNRGEVTGASGPPGAVEQAYLYSNGVMRSIGSLAGAFSAGLDINNAGDITGISNLSDAFPSNSSRAFLYANGVMRSIGTLGGTRSSGEAINDAGQIVGNSTLAGDGATHAFLYSDGLMRDLGTLAGEGNSFASDINNLGQIIGSSSLPGGAGAPFLYSDGVMTDLTTLVQLDGAGWDSLGQVNAISDNGYIVGMGTFRGEALHGYLLTPIGEIPEPSAMLLLLTGVAALRVLARRSGMDRRA